MIHSPSTSSSNLNVVLFFFLLTTSCLFSSCALALHKNTPVLPIVYTIAGSDSGGGAGIQADLHTIHTLGCHGCSAITCLTAQNSVGVTGVHAPPTSFLQQQLETLTSDMPPAAIKIGMLGTQELAECVGDFLKELIEGKVKRRQKQHCWVVVDPVMISTSGHKLIDDDAKQAMMDRVFPYTDILTPNKYEAEELVGRTLESTADVEQAAQEILAMGVPAVLIKGGHTLKDDNNNKKYSQDYFLSSSPPKSDEEPRLYEASDKGIWLRSERYVLYCTVAVCCVHSWFGASTNTYSSFCFKTDTTRTILMVQDVLFLLPLRRRLPLGNKDASPKRMGPRHPLNSWMLVVSPNPM